MRLVLMLLLGVALPQVAGFLVNRAVARWPATARALGVCVAAFTIATVLLVTFQLEVSAQRALGGTVVCATPMAAAFIMLVPGHAAVAALLQSQLHYGSSDGK